MRAKWIEKEGSRERPRFIAFNPLLLPTEEYKTKKGSEKKELISRSHCSFYFLMLTLFLQTLKNCQCTKSFSKAFAMYNKPQALLTTLCCHYCKAIEMEVGIWLTISLVRIICTHKHVRHERMTFPVRLWSYVDMLMLRILLLFSFITNYSQLSNRLVRSLLHPNDLLGTWQS